MTKVFVFPGQGSQKLGMGKELFGTFGDVVATADFELGYSIEELCIEDPRQELNETQFTQPALYVVNALSYLDRLKGTGRKPDFVAGHSLGEYSALFASGAYDFITGLRLVRKRGELMSRASGGGMAAIIGITFEQVENVIHNNGLASIDIANLNSPTQFIISGPNDEVRKAQGSFERAGARLYLPLKVSGAFHSRDMQGAKDEFAVFLNDFEFSPLTIPVISNARAKPYVHKDIKANLADQITSPVRWIESIQYLLSHPETEFDEIGPGSVLTRMIKQIQMA